MNNFTLAALVQSVMELLEDSASSASAVSTGAWEVGQTTWLSFCFAFSFDSFCRTRALNSFFIHVSTGLEQRSS